MAEGSQLYFDIKI